MVDILKGMDVSLCVFMAGIVAFVIAAILYLFLWETWSKAYEEDLEEETIEYYMIYTVWSKPESYGSRVILATADYLKAYAIDCIFTAVFFCYFGFYNGTGMTRFVIIQKIYETLKKILYH